MKEAMLLLLLGCVLLQSHAQLSDTEEEAGEAEVVNLFTTPRTKMAAAASDFGYNLFRQLAEANPKANVFLSPISISVALTQLSMGVSEQAEKQLHRALRYHTLQDSQLHQTLTQLLASIQTSRKGFSSAERLLLARKLRPFTDYLNDVERQYGIKPHTLTGGPRDLRTVNEWFKQQTGGKVDRVLSASLPRVPGVALVGAANFKGKWATRFSQTTWENFQLDGEAPISISMMQEEHYPIKMGIDSDLSCTIAQVDMEDGVSMYFFLPDEVTQNLTLIEETLTAEFVQDLSMTLQPVKAQLTLPVLRLSYSTDLLPLLSGLSGLTDYMAEQDFSKITGQEAKLSTVRHKVVLETMADGLSPSSTSQPNGVSYRVDRPFLFLLRDEPSGSLLFIGKVLNPRDLGRV